MRLRRRSTAGLDHTGAPEGARTRVPALVVSHKPQLPASPRVLVGVDLGRSNHTVAKAGVWAQLLGGTVDAVYSDPSREPAVALKSAEKGGS